MVTDGSNWVDAVSGVDENIWEIDKYSMSTFGGYVIYWKVKL